MLIFKMTNEALAYAMYLFRLLAKIVEKSKTWPVGSSFNFQFVQIKFGLFCLLFISQTKFPSSNSKVRIALPALPTGSWSL